MYPIAHNHRVGIFGFPPQLNIKTSTELIQYTIKHGIISLLGIEGFVLKRNAVIDLIPAIREIRRGLKYISPDAFEAMDNENR